ncbi:hypothetical protein PILCRDRAFT_5147 [Piloderma croceum F 1598]|uniref:Uncharacterized protein n=1 Tax=Piloderma croceum (strain F 1598) TaxID=765440 RepID=A0A0C3G610_PILCF|nr:hypothetical protein PILCRDRAFT_5147 [Piloderma croceum F 1598]
MPELGGDNALPNAHAEPIVPAPAPAPILEVQNEEDNDIPDIPDPNPDPAAAPPSPALEPVPNLPRCSNCPGVAIVVPIPVSHSLPSYTPCITLRDPLGTLSVGDQSAIRSSHDAQPSNAFDLNRSTAVDENQPLPNLSTNSRENYLSLHRARALHRKNANRLTVPHRH